ncbi:MAG TPA: MFS transporter [Gammaproteobacteria bacterium]
MRRHLRVLAVLFAGVLVGALDIAIVGPALPAIRESFGVDPRGLSWVFSVYILFYLLGAPMLAKLSDRRGRRYAYVLGLVLFAAGSLLVASAPVFPALLGGRALQAFGAGGMLPVASAVVAETFPLERRGRALGAIGAVFGVAFALGPLLGGLLLPYGWQWLFLINLPVVAAVIAAGWRVLPAQGARGAAPFDGRGAALLALSLGCLVWGASHVDAAALAASLASRDTLPWLLAAIAGGAAFWLVEHRARDPLLPPELLGTRALRRVGAIALAAGLVEAGMVFLPEIAVEGLHVAPARASFMLLPLVATLIVGAPAAGWLLDRRGAPLVLLLGLLLTSLGLAAFVLLPLSTATFYGAGICVGLGLSGLLGAPLRYMVLQHAGEERRGAGQGLLALFLSTGRLLGASVIGGSAAASGAGASAGYRTGLLVPAVACILAAVLAVGLLREGAGRPAEIP